MQEDDSDESDDAAEARTLREERRRYFLTLKSSAGNLLLSSWQILQDYLRHILLFTYYALSQLIYSISKR